MSIIIGLTGRARSGKDTAAAHLQAGGYVHLKFAGPIKAMLLTLPGMTEEHVEGDLKDTIHSVYGITPRRMMQTIGDWGRDLDPDFWVNAMRGVIENIERDEGRAHFVISDVRYDNEAAMVCEFGGIIAHIHRDKAAKVESHSSEIGIDPSSVDVLIRNDSSISDLHARIDGVVTAMARVG